MCKPEPVFHEQWYLETELAMLEAATKFVKPLIGAVMEIGCWEGRSAVVIANACYPEVLLAVDTWAGSESEHPDHETVRIARVRDVFAAFRENMQRATSGNFECHCLEAIAFLKGWSAPIKFCHIDAAHDYDAARETIELLLARRTPGAVLFGDDYQSANAGREDLRGSVERAVRETLPAWVTRGSTVFGAGASGRGRSFFQGGKNAMTSRRNVKLKTLSAGDRHATLATWRIAPVFRLNNRARITWIAGWENCTTG